MMHSLVVLSSRGLLAEFVERITHMKNVHSLLTQHAQSVDVADDLSVYI